MWVQACPEPAEGARPAPALPQPKLLQPLVIDAEVVSDLVGNRRLDLPCHLRSSVVHRLHRPLEDRDLVGQDQIVALPVRQRDALVQSKQPAPVLYFSLHHLVAARPLLHHYDNVVQPCQQLPGHLPNGIKHQRLKLIFSQFACTYLR